MTLNDLEQICKILEKLYRILLVDGFINAAYANILK